MLCSWFCFVDVLFLNDSRLSKIPKEETFLIVGPGILHALCCSWFLSPKQLHKSTEKFSALTIIKNVIFSAPHKCNFGVVIQQFAISCNLQYCICCCLW